MEKSTEVLNTRGSQYAPPSVGLSTLGIAHLMLCKSFRLKSMMGLGAFALGMAFFSAMAIGDRPNRSFSEYWEFMYEAFLVGMLPFFLVAVAGGVLRNEIKDGTLEYIWTRPISRLRTIGGLFASAVLITYIWTVVLSLGIQLGATYRGVDGIWVDYGKFLIACFGSVLAFSGLALLVAAYSGKYMAFGMLYIGFVEIGIGKLPTNINQIAIRHHIESIVAPVDGSILGGFFGSLLIAAVLAFFAGLIFRSKTYSLGSDKEE